MLVGCLDICVDYGNWWFKLDVGCNWCLIVWIVKYENLLFFDLEGWVVDDYDLVFFVYVGFVLYGWFIFEG